jgi:biotin carboxyl carrier protein
MKYFSRITILLLYLAAVSCKEAATEQNDGGTENTVTPVTFTTPEPVSLKDEITLNAVSAYLLKTDVKASINGYITRCNIHMGDKTADGQTLFLLETKEAGSLGNIINNLDSTFKFSGVSAVKSPVAGYITMLNHQPGDYVQDGEVLASIADKSSFGFVLSLPYEYRGLLKNNTTPDLQLPDGTILKGYVMQAMPAMDSVSQTQRVLIKTPGAADIPENLIAKVWIEKSTGSKPCLPVSAVLSDETQQNFWIMRLISDSVAVKVPVTKGIENDSLVEILSPALQLTDRIILSGNYSLPDTAKVVIQK